MNPIFRPVMTLDINRGFLGFAVLMLLVSFTLSAQNYSEYNWLFANSPQSMSFNKSDGRMQLDSVLNNMTGSGGGVVISDPVTADLLFYTDGRNVYDANGDLVPSNGVGLSGDPSIKNSAVVMPTGYTTGTYYVFTNSGGGGVNEIQYSIIDKNLNGNAAGGAPVLGDLSLLNQTTGMTNPGEAMILIEEDLDNFWLVVQDVSDLSINVLSIVNGATSGVQNFDPWTVDEPSFEISDFAFSPSTGKLALGPRDNNRNVTLVDFDTLSGNITMDRAILNTGNADTPTEAVSAVEWSSSGRQLYISRFGGTGDLGDLYQYDLDDTLNTVNSVLFQPAFRSYDIKRGPDQRIYHLYQQSSTDPIELGMVTAADSSAVSSNVFYDSLALRPANANVTQFPSFPAPHFESFDFVEIFVTDTCATRTTKFFSSVDPTPDSYFWDFGDGNTSTAVSPVHVYQAANPGVNVTLTVTLNGITETTNRIVDIVENTTTLDLGQDTIRCPGEVFTLDATENTAVAYYWNTGEGTPTIDVDTTGIYSVSVLTTSGCLVYDYIQIVTYEDNREFRNQWYFGENAGIDFNDPTSAIEDDNLIVSPQAAASVSDRNGELRFYTDGETVWNHQHEIMINGDDIGGDNTSMQGVMIAPFPGDSSTYYVFTSDPVWGDNTYDLKYSIVDMRYDSARGFVVQKDMTFMKNSSERITALGVSTANTWLITHEYGNNQFRSYPITVDGIGVPITSSAGSVMRFSEEKTGTGEMQAAAAGSIIALAFQDTDDNYVEIFDINDTTGVITQLAKIDIEEPTPSLIYGVEFSASANKLYVTTNSNGSKLLQYSMDSLFTVNPAADISATKFELGVNASANYGALATGSDGVIYMSVDGQQGLGTISNPTGDETDASFQENGFDLLSRVSRLGLPNFVQSLPTPVREPGIQYENACLGQPTLFEGSGTSNIDEFFWTFGDGTFAIVEDTFRVYNLVGDYNVSLNITNRCGLDTTFLETVTVNAIPIEPTLQDAATLCNGAITLAAWPRDSAELSYTWSTGETSREVTITSASLVSVYITDTTGCQSEPRFSFIDDTSPVVDLGPDQSLCQNSTFGDLEALNPGSMYTWSVNTTPNGNTTSVQSVDTAIPGTYVYRVDVEDIFNCITSDSVRLVVQNEPAASFNPTTTTGCGNDDGSIDINVSETGSFNYAITGPVNVGNTPITGPGNATQNALAAGAYVIDVSNVLTGCVFSENVNVADAGAPFSIDDVVETPGCPGLGLFTINLGGAGVPSTVNYELYDEFGNLVLPGAATVVANSFSISDLDSGTYSLVVEDQGGAGCIQNFDNAGLSGLALAEYTSEPQFYCDDQGRIGISPITVDPTNPIVYTWSGPNIVGSAVGDTINVASPGVYTVTSSGTGYCDVETAVEVTQNSTPTLSISITGNECDGDVILTAEVANAIGNTNYLWDDGSGAQVRTVTNSGTYEVTVFDQGSGCLVSAETDATVYDELTVFVTAGPNCDDNAEVFVSAVANITEDVTFSWVSSSGEVIEDSGAEISIQESGIYTVTVASNNNVCEATDNINAMVVPIDPEELQLAISEAFCSEDPDPSNNSVTLDPGSFSSYEWSLANSSVVLSNERRYTVFDQGVYQVKVTNGFTCVSDFSEVLDDCGPVIYAPNGFTPNNDGLNDDFFVYENPYVSNFNIKIFSRWGEMVYQSSEVSFRWNGVFGGQLLQNGTYVYIMSFESSLHPEEGVVVQRGGVALIR